MTQFDAKLLERGLICQPAALPTVSAAIIRVSKISYFKAAVATKAKFHVSIGHETVMGRATFFGLKSDTGACPRTSDRTNTTTEFDFTAEYLYENELLADKLSEGDAAEGGTSGRILRPPEAQFALMEFEKPVTCGRGFVVIGSKLDTDIHANTCRLAFHGHLLEPLAQQNYVDTVLPRLRVMKQRCKEAVVERLTDQFTVVCRGLFKKESKVDAFVGLNVSLSTGECGFIEGGFGQSGKFKVRIPGIVLPSLSLSLSLSPFLMAIFPGEPGLVGFAGAKDNGCGGDNWSYKTCKAPVKSSPSTNLHPSFYRPDALPVTKPTVLKHCLFSNNFLYKN